MFTLDFGKIYVLNVKKIKKILTKKLLFEKKSVGKSERKKLNKSLGIGPGAIGPGGLGPGGIGPGAIAKITPTTIPIVTRMPTMAEMITFDIVFNNFLKLKNFISI